MSVQRTPRTQVGLGTFSFSAVSTRPHTIKGTLTIPEINQGAAVNSTVVVTVNINGGSAIYTGQAGAKSFDTGAFLNAGDVLNVILTSSTPADNGLNAVKSTIVFS